MAAVKFQWRGKWYEIRDRHDLRRFMNLSPPPYLVKALLAKVKDKSTRQEAATQ